MKRVSIDVIKGIRSKHTLRMEKADKGFIRILGNELAVGYIGTHGTEYFYSIGLEQVKEAIRLHDTLLLDHKRADAKTKELNKKQAEEYREMCARHGITY